MESRNWSELGSAEVLRLITESFHSSESLFPIPMAPRPPRPLSKHRSTQRRYWKALILWEHIDRLIRGLNLCWRDPVKDRLCTEKESEIESVGRQVIGAATRAEVETWVPEGATVESSFRHVPNVSDLHLECWQRVSTAATKVREGRRVSLKEFPTGAALHGRVRKLLCDQYGKAQQVKGTYAPFVSANIKENPAGSAVVDLIGYLGGSVKETVEDQSKMLKHMNEEQEREWRDTNKRYNMVGGDYDEWVHYLNSEKAAGLWRYHWQDETRANCAVLAVGRSKDSLLRKIMAVVPFNEALQAPQAVLPDEHRQMGMVGGAALATTHAKEGTCAWSGLDEGQAFTSCAAVPWWVVWQAAPAVWIRDLKPELRPPKPWKSKKIRPCYTRLAMGHAWSVLLLMLLHLRIAERSLKRAKCWALRSFTILNYSFANGTAGNATAESGVLYIHVDDFLFGHVCKEIANAAAVVVRDALVELGFIVDYSEVGVLEKLVGISYTSTPACLVPLVKKLGDLDRALEFLEQSEMVSADYISSVLGLWQWLVLIWRPALSAATSIYKFAELFRGCEAVSLWASVRRDLGRMRITLAFAECDLGAAWLSAVTTQDAAGGAPGSIQGKCGSFCMAIGFPRKVDVAAMMEKCVVRGLTTSGAQQEPGVVEEVLPRTVVPRRAIYDSPWFTMEAARFRFPEHINVLESKSSLRWSVVMAKIRQLWGIKWVDLSDSSATVGSWSRGRSSRSWKLNRVQQQRLALEAITKQRQAPAWIGTEDEVADYGTREGLRVLANLPPAPRLVTYDEHYVIVLSWRTPRGLRDIDEPHLTIWNGTTGADTNCSTPKGLGRLLSWVASGRASAVIVYEPTVLGDADCREEVDVWWAGTLSAVTTAFKVALEYHRKPFVSVFMTQVAERKLDAYADWSWMFAGRLNIDSYLGLEHQVCHFTDVSTKDRVAALLPASDCVKLPDRKQQWFELACTHAHLERHELLSVPV